MYTIDVTNEDGESVSVTLSSQGPGSKFTLDGNNVKLAVGQTLDFEDYSGPYTLEFTYVQSIL